MNSDPILYIQQIAVGSKTAEGSNPAGKEEETDRREVNPHHPLIFLIHIRKNSVWIIKTMLRLNPWMRIRVHSSTTRKLKTEQQETDEIKRR